MSQPKAEGSAVRHFLTQLGVYTANPLAFLVLIVYAALWILFKPETFEWHAVATLATWGMTLVIQRAEHRDPRKLSSSESTCVRTIEPTTAPALRRETEEDWGRAGRR